jgi:hypothetical protein
MSSSNSVRVAVIEETSYGETPAAGNFETARFISETLSGSPETTESQQIRTDRQSSGQIVTGLTVGGDLNFELANGPVIDLLMKGAMMKSSWTTSLAVNVDLEIDATAKTLTRSAGDFNSDVAVGDMITLAGFSNSVNNTQVMIAAINSATEIRYVGPNTLADETGVGTSFQVADKAAIGTDRPSFSLEKAFLDLTEKAINYRGMYVAGMSLNVNYGEIVNGSFTFSGNDYETVSAAANFITNGRTINNPATTQSINGSIDMPFIASDVTGTLSESDFCIQAIGIELENNLTAQTCIGKAAPTDYSPGTAGISISMDAYLSDTAWSILGKKLTQASFSIGFMVKNDDGWYGFYLPAIQVTFDDPASAGQNQDVILNMSGTAKVGSAGESALTIYKY